MENSGLDFDLKHHTILWTIGGSRCYGIHTKESDVDTKGICIPPARYYHGALNTFEQTDSQQHLECFRDLLNEEETNVAAGSKLEGVVYEVRKFIKLATECNPNILDVLFCRDEDVRLMTPLGKLLRNNRQLFVSARAKHSFSGYAIAQMRRLENDKSNTFKTSRGKNRQDLTEKYGYDTKYAAHLVRLMRMSHEIMDSGAVNVYRGNIDANELIQIRQGAWKYEDVISWAKAQDQKLTLNYNNGKYAIPHSPDRNAINSLCCEIVERHLAGEK